MCYPKKDSVIIAHRRKGSGQMNELILINVSGEDKPGLTSSITRLLGEYDVDILDIGQAVIHSYLTLGILIRVPSEAESSPILKDILFLAHELAVSIHFTGIESAPEGSSSQVSLE